MLAQGGGGRTGHKAEHHSRVPNCPLRCRAPLEAAWAPSRELGENCTWRQTMAPKSVKIWFCKTGFQMVWFKSMFQSSKYRNGGGQERGKLPATFSLYCSNTDRKPNINSRVYRDWKDDSQKSSIIRKMFFMAHGCVGLILLIHFRFIKLEWTSSARCPFWTT